jgi:tetratricopeptide (TPR) repeat protein
MGSRQHSSLAISANRCTRALIICTLVIVTVAWAQGGVDTLLEQARAAEKISDYAAATRIYERALVLSPGNLEVLKRLGVLEQTELKFDSSISHFQQVLAREAQYPEVNFFVGMSYFGQGDFQGAIHSFKLELENAKPHPRCRYYLALALQSTGRLQDAISQLNQAIANNPNDADALFELARMHKSASLQAIDRLKTIDQDSFQLHALMGEIYAEEKRYPEAIKEYRSALEKRPDAQGIHFSIGVAYWAQRQPADAQKEFSLALKQNPGDPMTNLYMGDIAVQEQRFPEALTYLQVAQKAHLEIPQMHVLLGNCYQALHDLENAKTEFLAAINADPGAAPPHYLLAQVYRELHNPEASARELTEYQSLLKSNADKAFESRNGSDRDSK